MQHCFQKNGWVWLFVLVYSLAFLNCSLQDDFHQNCIMWENMSFVEIANFHKPIYFWWWLLFGFFGGVGRSTNKFQIFSDFKFVAISRIIIFKCVG